MPRLHFSITEAEPAARALAPLLHFKLRIRNEPASETIHGVMLNAQIQIQSPQRKYSPSEKEKLVEIFGAPDRWGETLRNRLWAHANATVNSFSGSTDVLLPVPCTFDLNVLATKYFFALEDGDIPLIFLFSGSVFYAADDGCLQVQRISWDSECGYRMSLKVWEEMMSHHFPNTAWLTLERSVFDRLSAFKRRHGIATWEEAMERLLPDEEKVEVEV